MHRTSLHRAVEIHDVNTTSAFRHPMFRRRKGALEINCLFVHFALEQADASAVLNVDGRNDDHEFIRFLRIGRSWKECAVPALGFFRDETGKRKDDPWLCLKQTGFRNLLSWR